MNEQKYYCFLPTLISNLILYFIYCKMAKEDTAAQIYLVHWIPNET